MMIWSTAPNALPAGLGDWADPGCEPGTEGCVPHWYCYIPFMATPDCLKSFGEGVKEIASGAAGAVVGAAGEVASGVGEGVGAGVQSGFCHSLPSLCDANGKINTWLILGVSAAVISGVVLLARR